MLLMGLSAPPSDVVLRRHDEGLAALARQERIGYRIPDERLLVGIDGQPRAKGERGLFDVHPVIGQVLADLLEPFDHILIHLQCLEGLLNLFGRRRFAQPLRDIGHVDHRRRRVSLRDVGGLLLAVAAPHGLDEVAEMVDVGKARELLDQLAVAVVKGVAAKSLRTSHLLFRFIVIQRLALRLGRPVQPGTQEDIVKDLVAPRFIVETGNVRTPHERVRVMCSLVCSPVSLCAYTQVPKSADNGGTGIVVRGAGTKIYHNTVYGNKTGLEVKGTKNVEIKNNLVIGGSSGLGGLVAKKPEEGTQSGDGGVQRSGRGSRTSGRGSRTSSRGAASAATNTEPVVADNLTEGDPMFVDPEKGDFRLKEWSPAAGFGAIL